MANDFFKTESKTIIGEHIKEQVHPVTMNKPAGYHCVDIFAPRNRVRMEH
jgi:hypothetical protein